MAIIYLAITGDEYSVSRRVHRTAVEAFLQNTGLKDFEIVFDEDIKSVRQTTSEDMPSEPKIQTANRDAVFVDPVERYSEDALTMRHMTLYRKKPIVIDEMIGLSARTVFINAEVTLTMRVRFTSKNRLLGWTKSLAMVEKRNPLSFRFPVYYGYTIPAPFGYFVAHVHSLMENVAPYGRTLEEYVSGIMKNDYNQVHNRSKGYTAYTLEERQDGVIGYLTGEMAYNEKEVEEGVYEVPIEFKFNYEQPSHLYCEIPLIVHNQMIDDVYINSWIRGKDAEPEETTTADTRLAPDPIHKTQYLGDGGTRFFDFDDYFPKKVMEDTRTLFIMPVQVSESDKKLVCNLSDLSEEYIDQSIVSYIRNNWETVTEPYAGPYYVEVIELNDIELRHHFSIDGNDDIRTEEDLDLRLRYYLRVSYVSDHSRLPNNVIKTFLSDVDMAVSALQGIRPNIVVTTKHLNGALHVLPDRSITQYSYNIAILGVASTSNVLKRAKSSPGKYPKNVLTDKIIITTDKLKLHGVDKWLEENHPDLYQDALDKTLTDKNLELRTGISLVNENVSPYKPSGMRTVVTANVISRRQG